MKIECDSCHNAAAFFLIQDTLPRAYCQAHRTRTKGYKQLTKQEYLIWLIESKL